jgi:tetratricopeptide (TPR) repeat protein
LYPLPFLIFLGALLYRLQTRHRIAHAAVHVRQRALRLALRSLDELKKRGTKTSAQEFLGSVADTIERYISQKFEFAATGRTFEELKEELLTRRADATTVAGLTAFIETLDAYRFGGVAFDEKSRTEVLDKAAAFLSGLEKSSKQGKKSVTRSLSSIAPLLLLVVLTRTPLAAPLDHWFERANTFYAAQNFDSAVAYYEKIVAAGAVSPAVYFNLGNAYFRLKKAGLARLCYEKAARLDPADKDIAANVKFLESSIVDRVPEPQRGFLDSVFWQLHILLPLSLQLWLCFALLLVIALLASAALYLRGTTRLWLIYAASLLSLVLLLSGLSMSIKIYQSEKVGYAILLEPSADAKNEPDGAKIIFTAHEGTKFLVRKSLEGWSLVSLPNGLSGWVENKALGKI